jgi:hypothetical protein
MSAAIVKAEPIKIITSNLVGLSRKQLEDVDNETLCAAVVAGFKFFHDAVKASMPILIELRQRFLDKEKDETIGGFSSWKTFCPSPDGLNHSCSYVRQLIRNNGAVNPAAKHDGSKNNKRLKISNKQLADSGSEAVAAAEVKRKVAEAFEQGRIAERKFHRTAIAPTPTVPVDAATRLGIADELVKIILSIVGDNGLVSQEDGKIFRNYALRYESVGRPLRKPEPPQPKKTPKEQQAQQAKAAAQLKEDEAPKPTESHVTPTVATSQRQAEQTPLLPAAAESAGAMAQ